MSTKDELIKKLTPVVEEADECKGIWVSQERIDQVNSHALQLIGMLPEDIDIDSVLAFALLWCQLLGNAISDCVLQNEDIDPLELGAVHSHMAVIVAQLTSILIAERKFQ